MDNKNSAQIYKSNALVEASYRLSVAEQRIMLTCMSKIRKDQPITDDQLYSVSVSEISNLTGVMSNAAYSELENAALRLKRREVRINVEPNGNGKKAKTLITGWVQTIAYVESEGRIELRFSKDMLPYLTELSEQFTQYALADVAKMTSAYGIRLYELLIQYQHGGCSREFSLDELRELLRLENKYPSTKDFKKWVIEPAVEQINEYSPIRVNWSQRKTGRRISHIQFDFTKKARIAKPRKKQVEIPSHSDHPINENLAPKNLNIANRSTQEIKTASSVIEQIKMNLG